MRLRCPRCGSADVHIETPWTHLHCRDCGLRRFGSSFEPQTSSPATSSVPHGRGPVAGPSAPTEIPPTVGESKHIGVFGILLGVPAALGFILGSRIAAFILLFSLLLSLVSLLRRRWKQKYLLYTALIFVSLLGGILHDVIFPPTALCVDGTYSYSRHESGTCSWHGGVAEWGPDPWWRKMFER